MTLRDRMCKVADKVRTIAGRSNIDERPTSVTVRRRTWLGGRTGAEGGYTDVDLVLAPRPRVKQLSVREITNSGGRYVSGDMRIGPITPAYSGGGYSEAQLAPVINVNGVSIIYVLAGNVNGEFSRLDLETDRTHAFYLVVRQKRATP